MHTAVLCYAAVVWSGVWRKWIYNFTQKDTAHIQFDLSNLSQIGSTKGTIKINPIRSITEEHYFNNTLFFDFYVELQKYATFYDFLKASLSYENQR